MSKEKHAAWRSMNRTPDPVMDNADMEGTGLRWRNAPVVNNVSEDALHTIWTSERKRLVDGRWYIPISEVNKVLTE